MGKRTERSSTLAKRFWSKVEMRGLDECWPWTGAVGSDGYGGRHAPVLATHRVACGIESEPGDIHARHTCDFALCCNPVHLIAGTRQENMDDMVARRRNRTGRPGNGRTKITPEKRLQVVALKAAGQNHSAIARQFGVTPGRVRQILQEAA